MFAGTSKAKLIAWALIFAGLAVACAWLDHTNVVTLSCSGVFLIVAIVLFFAVKSKIDRDASYQEMSQFPDEPERPASPLQTSSESNYFGPPTLD
jgi:hypothetical protein